MDDIKTLHQDWIAETAYWRSQPPAAFAEVPFLDSGQPVPFEHALVPVVLVAVRRLRQRSIAITTILSEAAQAQMARDLLWQAADICGGVLLLAFNITRSIPGTPAQRDRLSTFPPGSQMYWDFVYTLLDKQWNDLWAEYPEMVRLLACITQDWIAGAHEMVERLTADWHLIRQALRSAPDSPFIQAVKTNLSDPHHGHRTVHILQCATGVEFVYKPRSVSMEAEFYAFVAALNSQHVGQLLETPWVLARFRYGWMEKVVPAPCESLEAVQRYYRRIGQLLCLLHLLGGTDAHGGNLIASGEHPVLIDLETLFHPRMPLQDNHSPDTMAEQLYWDTVLRTGLLPMRHILGSNYDVSGLGMRPGMRVPIPLWRWISANSDQMQRRQERPSVTQTDHCAIWEGSVAQPETFTADITAGYEDYYHWIAANRQFCAMQLRRFVGLQPRLLRRNTWEYTTLIQQLNRPSQLRAPQPEPPADFTLSERTAVQNREIPLLYGEKLTPDRVNDCLERVRQAECAVQTALIQISNNAAPFSTMPAADSQMAPPASSTRAAYALLEKIKRGAVWVDDELHWIGLEHFSRTRETAIQPLAFNLNSGRVGIALFLAALNAVTGDQQVREYALATVRPLQRLLNVNSYLTNHLQTRMSVGGVVGLGSLLYGLLRIGCLLQERGIETAVCQVAHLLTRQRLLRSSDGDVMNGLAGAVLALLAYHRVTGEPQSLRAAADCGAFLQTFHPQQAGFAHGKAGIATALLRLAQATNNEQMLADAHQLLIESTENLADLSWCNGVTGTSLARLSSFRITKNPALLVGIEASVTAVCQESGSTTLDTLCCGTAGQLELLLTAGSTGWHDYGEAVREWKEGLIKRLDSLRVVQHAGAVEVGIPNTGFFHGYTGIGYQLLRAEQPHRLPAVLLFE